MEDPRRGQSQPLKRRIKDVQYLNEFSHGIHGDAGREHCHRGKGNRVEGTGFFVEAQTQIFRHRTRARAVVERHHENADKHHRGYGADPVKMAGRDSVLRPRSGHSDYFLRAQVRRNKSQSADPRGDGTTGEKEISAGTHISLQRQANAQHKDEIDDHDGPVNCSQHQGSCGSFYFETRSKTTPCPGTRV